MRASLESFVPGLGDAHLLRKLKLVDVHIELIIADPVGNYRDYEDRSFITIGSGRTNGMSRFIEPRLVARLVFDEPSPGVQVRETRHNHRGLIYCRRGGSGNVWLYAAGVGESDTVRSAEYLRRNWSLLFERHCKTDFYYVLNTETNPATVVEHGAIG